MILLLYNRDWTGHALYNSNIHGITRLPRERYVHVACNTNHTYYTFSYAHMHWRPSGPLSELSRQHQTQTSHHTQNFIPYIPDSCQTKSNTAEHSGSTVGLFGGTHTEEEELSVQSKVWSKGLVPPCVTKHISDQILTSAVAIALFTVACTFRPRCSCLPTPRTYPAACTELTRECYRVFLRLTKPP